VAEAHDVGVRGLDRTRPDDAAFLIQAAHVLRCAGYAKLDATNTASAASVPIHAGVAAPYAHVTAPLRRLADRYANEIVLAHCAGADSPEWAGAALDDLVTVMQQANQRAAAVERAVVDAVECAVLAPSVGRHFDGVVVERARTVSSSSSGSRRSSHPWPPLPHWATPSPSRSSASIRSRGRSSSHRTGRRRRARDGHAQVNLASSSAK
jgi:hypothetical protein